ncbi:phosphoribosyltransferase domain-containing protein [Massilia sp. PWRC2]|uniref:phosphoribosyltransferase domain-containing protein n=1 Tax=Massilia sp. PWRC2 TaxID=2804626 RepID=UPI003CF39A69
MSHSPTHYQVLLPTGALALTIERSDCPLDDIMGFAARDNAKRGFLFLSKVLGKHWPVRPAAMTAIHARLAAAVPPLAGPVVFIAMAETAIGLGQGVFEAWLRLHPDQPALFLHSSRYRVGDTDIVEFEEAHSHAPRQFLHLPPADAERQLLLTAKALVLVDDEASTGNTFINLAHACRALNPAIGHVHLATITNFMGDDATAALSARCGVPVTLASPVSGHYQFTAGQFSASGAPAQRFDADAERGASGRFGRHGLRRALRAPAALAARLANDIAPDNSVLVLGTGEFMHAPYLLGAALEQLGVNVMVQSSTRSPILTWGAVATRLAFADNYGEGVANYLYNVRRGQYQHVLICHETPANAALRQLAQLLDARLFYFQSETQIDEVS